MSTRSLKVRMMETLAINGERDPAAKAAWCIMIGRTGVEGRMQLREGIPTAVFHGYREDLRTFPNKVRLMARQVFVKPKKVEDFLVTHEGEDVQVFVFQESQPDAVTPDMEPAGVTAAKLRKIKATTVG